VSARRLRSGLIELPVLTSLSHLCRSATVSPHFFLMHFPLYDSLRCCFSSQSLSFVVSILPHPPCPPPLTPSVLIHWYRPNHEVACLADMRKLFVHAGSRASACSGVSLRHLVPHCLPHPPALPHPPPLSHHTLLLWPCCPQTTPAGPCCCSGQSPLHNSCVLLPTQLDLSLCQLL